jgi:hypothetical protein
MIILGCFFSYIAVSEKRASFAAFDNHGFSAG